MCRMIGIRTKDPALRLQFLKEFRSLADRSYTGPERLQSHRDGWGLVGLVDKGPLHLGRAPQDASRDPAYEDALAKAGRIPPDSVMIGHVRNGSVGGRELRNTHPFVREGWAFCHNGTVHGLLPPAGAKPEGQTDSEAYFLHLLNSVRRSRTVEAAVRETVERIHAAHKYTSLTFLLTNGRDLYSYREVGHLYGSCGTRECALEHYVMGYSTVGDSVVAVQEPQAHPSLGDWTPIPNGGLLILKHGQPPTIVDLVGPVVA